MYEKTLTATVEDADKSVVTADATVAANIGGTRTTLLAAMLILGLVSIAGAAALDSASAAG